MGISAFMCRITMGFVLLLGIQALSVSAKPQEQDLSLDTLADWIDSLVKEGEPGLSVGIVRDGEVIFRHSVGLANLENGTKITAQSRFNNASNAKQFTALMVLDLAARGKVDLDADFRTYLSGAMPNVKAKISVKDLITHTSGVRDITELLALTGVTWYEEKIRNQEAMALFYKQNRLNFSPGTKYLYSNSNYILLAELVAAVTGQRFRDYASAFFKARGMAATGYRPRYSSVVPNRARPYGYWNAWIETVNIANTYGDGFLFTSLDDQLHWEKQVWGAGRTLADSVMAASQQPIDGAGVDDYGYGPELISYRGKPVVQHVGSTGGANAFTMRFPDKRTSIVVLGNTMEVSVVGVGRQMAHAALGEWLRGGPTASYPVGPAEAAAKPAKEYLGTYELPDNTLIKVVERDGAYYREIEWADRVRLIPEDGNLLRYESNANLVLALSNNLKGDPQFTLYMPSVAPRVARASSPLPPIARPIRRQSGVFL